MGSSRKLSEVNETFYPRWAAIACAAVVFCKCARSRLDPEEIIGYWCQASPELGFRLLKDAYHKDYLHGNLLLGDFATTDLGMRCIRNVFGWDYANRLMLCGLPKRTVDDIRRRQAQDKKDRKNARSNANG